MDAKTLEAIKASIAKWEKNAEALGPIFYTTGISDCPLCKEFFADDCKGCPISEKTGRSRCGESPYGEAADARSAWWDFPSSFRRRVAAHNAARAEVDFLQSLLPQERI